MGCIILECTEYFNEIVQKAIGTVNCLQYRWVDLSKFKMRKDNFHNRMTIHKTSWYCFLYFSEILLMKKFHCFTISTYKLLLALHRKIFDWINRSYTIPFVPRQFLSICFIRKTCYSKCHSTYCFSTKLHRVLYASKKQLIDTSFFSRTDLILAI